MINHFSQEEFEETFHIKDADLQKMVKVLNDVNIKECPYFELSDKYGNSARYYRENQWIPCSERLPKYGQVVLWRNEYGSVFTSAITGNIGYSWHIGRRHWGTDVVAWMPLPEPWKGGKQ